MSKACQDPKKKPTTESKIIQLMPAPGWRVVYVRDDLEHLHTEELNVVGWGLIQRGNKKTVELLHWNYRLFQAVSINNHRAHLSQEKSLVVLAPGEELPEDENLAVGLFGHRLFEGATDQANGGQATPSHDSTDIPGVDLS